MNKNQNTPDHSPVKRIKSKTQHIKVKSQPVSSLSNLSCLQKIINPNNDTKSKLNNFTQLKQKNYSTNKRENNPKHEINNYDYEDEMNKDLFRYETNQDCWNDDTYTNELKFFDVIVPNLALPDSVRRLQILSQTPTSL